MQFYRWSIGIHSDKVFFYSGSCIFHQDVIKVSCLSKNPTKYKSLFDVLVHEFPMEIWSERIINECFFRFVRFSSWTVLENYVVIPAAFDLHVGFLGSGTRVFFLQKWISTQNVFHPDSFLILIPFIFLKFNWVIKPN